MNKLRAWINAHPLIAFFVVACGYSWGLWGWMMASDRGWLPFPFPSWMGSFGPSIAAVIVITISRGRTGIQELLRPILQWRFSGRWYLWVVIGCTLPFFASLFVVAWLKPGTATLGFFEQLVLLPLYYPLILVIGGSLGEEIGWRGYALPSLLKQRSALSASLIIFLMWMVWHLPLFWLEGASQQGSSVFVFLITLMACSVLFTWVYRGTSGSLLSVLLFHTGINVFWFILEEASLALSKDLLLNGIYAGIWVAIALVVIAMRGASLSGQQDWSGANRPAAKVDRRARQSI